MGQTVRVSLPTYDALTDSDPRHYSLFADSDNVLLKEKVRGTLSANGTYTHSSGYIPFYLVFGDMGGGIYQLCTGWDANSGVPKSRTTINILKTKTKAMKYFIFYDNIN